MKKAKLLVSTLLMVLCMFALVGCSSEDKALGILSFAYIVEIAWAILVYVATAIGTVFLVKWIFKL